MMDLIRAARALLRLRQDQLAELANVSRQTIVRIESLKKGIPVDSVEKIRAALEEAGVEFLSSTPDRGPGIALRKKKPRT